MAIDFEREQLVSIPQAAQRIPGRPSLRTMWRWVNHGVGGQRLETILCGGRRFTSAEAIRRFVERQTDGPNIRAERIARSQRERQIAAAERELQQAGF